MELSAVTVKNYTYRKKGREEKKNPEKDKFIIGAGGRKTLGATGGGSVKLTEAHLPSHKHRVKGTTSEDGNHKHSHTCDDDDGGGSNSAYAMGDGKKNTKSCKLNSAGKHTHNFDVTSYPAGGGQAFAVEPVYYALSFIMKLPPTAIEKK
jgi:microcystin-dependent protein